MAIPASFARDGFGPLPKGLKKRLMIAIEGESDTGKSEFALSAPGPTIGIILDRMIDGVLDNPNPPSTRGKDVAYKIIQAPLAGTDSQASYGQYWVSYRDTVYKACANPDCRTILTDGDSDSWELQRLAEFGRLEKVPSIMYTSVNASRRAYIAHLWDSGKIIIATNKIKEEYTDEINAVTGLPVMGNDGKPRRVKSGVQSAQGFADVNYLWHIRLKTLYRPAYYNEFLKAEIPQQWGIHILKCKANTALKGTELWGDECNFRTLVNLVYPQISDAEWGY